MSKKQVSFPSGSVSIRGPIRVPYSLMDFDIVYPGFEVVYQEKPDGGLTVVEVKRNLGRTEHLYQEKPDGGLTENLGRTEHLLIEANNLLQQMLDEADSAVDDTVPELGQKLLPFLLPRKLRDNVAGDLAQDFQGYVAKFGRTYAVRWYWWELGRLLRQPSHPYGNCRLHCFLVATQVRILNAPLGPERRSPGRVT
jgi:hypothetical protein